MSRNVFENGPSESERTLQATGCCTTISRQLTELSIREFLAKKNIPTLPHPPYNPDLAPCDHVGTVTDELKTLIKMTSGTAPINGNNVGITA
jgi:hypothetical protein